MKLKLRVPAIERVFMLLGFCLFLACGPDEVVPDYETCSFIIPACDPSSFSPGPSDVEPIGDSICLIDQGTLTLLGDTKRYLWFYCDAVNALLYEDSLGNQLQMDIVSKSHQMKKVYAYGSGPGCTSLAYASIREVMEVVLTNAQINLKIKLTLRPDSLGNNLFDGLSVDKTTFDDNRPYWFNQVLYMFLSIRDPDVSIVLFRHNPSLYLQGQSYSDVYWNDGHHNVKMEIYYNQECGLLAFRDDQGTLWTLAGYL